MEKINFVNNTTPALNATNLNKLQQNAEDGLDRLQESVSLLSDGKLNITDIKNTFEETYTRPYSCNYINYNLEQLDNKFNYSTTEQVIGKWVDNKPIYRKVINTGALPNATTKEIQHNISNLNQIINIKGFAYRSSDSFTIPLPFVAIDNLNYNIYLAVLGNNIRIQTGNDRSAFLVSYITLEYTKTTD